MYCSILFLFQFFFVLLHKSYYLCRMQQDYDSSASGYLMDSFEGISRQFTDVEIMYTSEVNVVAKAKRYGRWWLLKGLRKKIAGEAGYQQRLRKELEILMQLQHPGVVTAVGLEDVESLGLCIVMEYVDGVTLREWLQNKTNRQQRRHVAIALCETIGYIHSKGIVHRDLKPENIMITHNGGNVKLIDFGLADTDSHAILKQPAGTSGYMSPEQAQTAVADVRNDIYSLGMVMQQMGLGFAYRHITNRCLAPLEDRYKTTGDLKSDLRRIQTGKWLAWACGGLMVAVLIVLALVWGPATKVDNAIERQQTEQQKMQDAISKGCAYIDERMASTHMNEHLDTLSSVVYLRADYVEVLSNSFVWVDEFLQTLNGDFTSKDITIIKDALDSHLSKTTTKWNDKFNQLKNAYDSQFTP